jgi:hypothetical protein
MAQLEYGDFYKFVVSVGITLIVLAAGLLWLFLREPFDLLIESSKLAAITPVAKNVIMRRQELTALIWTVVPWAASAVVLSGVTMVSFGLRGWRRRQNVRDLSEDLSVKKLGLELHTMSAEEVSAKAIAEVEDDAEPLPTPSQNAAASSASLYLDIENTLYSKILKCCGQTHNVLVRQSMGAARYDAILVPLDQSTRQTDVIVELKYIQRGFRASWLSESVNRLAVSTELYSNTTSRKVTAVLIIVLATSATTARNEKLKDLALMDVARSGIELRVEYVSEVVFREMKCDHLKHLIFGRA